MHRATCNGQDGGRRSGQELGSDRLHTLAGGGHARDTLHPRLGPDMAQLSESGVDRTSMCLLDSYDRFFAYGLENAGQAACEPVSWGNGNVKWIPIAVGWIGTVILLSVIWQHAHWSVSLALTILALRVCLDDTLETFHKWRQQGTKDRH